MGKGRNCSQEQFLLFSTIFYNLILDFCVITRNRFSLRDKQLFEITEVEITRVDCTGFTQYNRIRTDSINDSHEKSHASLFSDQSFTCIRRCPGSSVD